MSGGSRSKHLAQIVWRFEPNAKITKRIKDAILFLQSAKLHSRGKAGSSLYSYSIRAGISFKRLLNACHSCRRTSKWRLDGFPGMKWESWQAGVKLHPSNNNFRLKLRQQQKTSFFTHSKYFFRVAPTETWDWLRANQEIYRKVPFSKRSQRASSPF